MRLFFSLIALCACVCVPAQTMRNCFKTMPDDVCRLLTAVNRADCVDFLDSNMRAVVKNRFQNTSELKVLTDDYFLLQLTEGSTMEAKLLPLTDTTRCVCVVRTALGPWPDSRVQFYDTKWQPLDIRWDMPTANDYPRLDGGEADMLLCRCALSADSTTMTCTCTAAQFAAGREAVGALPKPQQTTLEYDWLNATFVRR